MCDQKNGGDHDDDVDELSASDESEPEERLSSAAFVPELDEDDDDDDVDREVVTSAPAVGAQSPFSLRGGGAAFSDRSHSIFDCLDSVSRLTSSSSLKQENITDGVFARPLPPPPSRKTSQPQSSCPTPAKKKGAPDYLVHPERWTHYSLENVSETSDQGNSRAALNYLSSLQQRKEQQESPSDSSCNAQQKMIFRPSRPQKEQPADQSSAVRSREKETRLSHLEEEEEEEGRDVPHGEGRRTEQSVEKAEDIDRRAAVGRAGEKKQVEKEKVDEEQKKMEEANPSFTSFRKTKHKNYRKSSGQEDN